MSATIETPDKSPATWLSGVSNRRAQIENLTPAEAAIREAAITVEVLGADPRLTGAVAHLLHAQRFVADYVDGVSHRDVATARALGELAHSAAQTLIERQNSDKRSIALGGGWELRRKWRDGLDAIVGPDGRIKVELPSEVISSLAQSAASNGGEE